MLVSLNSVSSCEVEHLVEGGLRTGFWGLYLLFSGTSLCDLYKALITEHSASEKFSKISSAVKTTFSDLASLCGVTAYNIYWAHEVKILSLGKYAQLVKGLGYGASMITSAAEGGWAIYNIHIETKEISKANSTDKKEKHQRQLRLSLMKLIGSISMIAWTALGIAMVATSLTISPLLMTALLATGCAFPCLAFFYEKNIKDKSEIKPIPN